MTKEQKSDGEREILGFKDGHGLMEKKLNEY